VRRERVDAIVIGGDVVPGPMPRECLDLLRSLKIPTHFIPGNGERVTLAQRQRVEPTEVPEAFRDVIRWNAEQLTDEHARWIASWPKTLSLENVLFCHASPRNDVDVFTRQTPEEDIAPVFAAVRERTVVCGHTHMQYDRLIAYSVGNTRVVNAGSVGMSFQGTGAFWLILSPDVELRRTEYDLNAAAERIRATAYPQAETFAGKNVLHPPTEDQMLAAYANVPLKF
jgi:diadenosine tetraphosphatase ApaH/serine/threonine PP2A family protein phosphatase